MWNAADTSPRLAGTGLPGVFAGGEMVVALYVERKTAGKCGEFTTRCGVFEKHHESLVSPAHGVFFKVQ